MHLDRRPDDALGNPVRFQMPPWLNCTTAISCRCPSPEMPGKAAPV
jgi:hypothetical protein